MTKRVSSNQGLWWCSVFISNENVDGQLNHCPQIFTTWANSAREAKEKTLKRLRESGLPNIAEFEGPYAPKLKDKPVKLENGEMWHTTSYPTINEYKVDVFALLLAEVEKSTFKRMNGDVIYISMLDG